MHKDLELWQFIANRLRSDQNVMLLVVAESSGSSPGRQGYKMAVGTDGSLCGSIGGGVMEVNLVEEARRLLSEPPAVAGVLTPFLRYQVHQKTSENASGMICSGRQTVAFARLSSDSLAVVERVVTILEQNNPATLILADKGLFVVDESILFDFGLDAFAQNIFTYQERLGPKNNLFIVGGGHCALALSELMSRMGFRIRIFDDRPELNTIEKNKFADEIEIIESYEKIADHIESAPNAYVVVMTLGYAYDKMVIQRLLEKEFKYFGVLGSKAKMATLMKELRNEGYDEAKLKRIHTPIGIPINSRTPEEIAVSIAAEIIAVKNR